MDTLVFASLMGLYYWFARLRLGYTFSAMLLQPVVIAVFVGLLLGNMETAMIIGAGMQRGPGLDFVVLGVARIQSLVQSGAIAVQRRCRQKLFGCAGALFCRNFIAVYGQHAKGAAFHIKIDLTATAAERNTEFM